MPAAPPDHYLYRLNQDVVYHASLEDNVADIPFPTDEVSPESSTVTCTPSPSSDSSVQEMSQPNDNGGRCTRTRAPCRRRGARKQSLR